MAVTIPGAGHASTVAEMKDARRILIIAAPSRDDPNLAKQRQALAGWRQGAADRDLETIEVVGEAVSGSDDKGSALRQRYDLPPKTFSVILIGKDGHVALRSATPWPASQIESAIDAMPMRRAGQR